MKIKEMVGVNNLRIIANGSITATIDEAKALIKKGSTITLEYLPNEHNEMYCVR